MLNKMVSVIIPVYNGGSYVTEAVECALGQSYKNLEVIVVDDGSADNTSDVLMPYASDKRLQYYSQDNRGPACARNKGITHARGEYIAFLDSDDLWDNDKLKKSIGFMEGGNFDWICTAMLKIRSDGEKIIKRITPDSWVINSRNGQLNQLKNGLYFFSAVPIHTPTIVVKTSNFKKAGLFDESFLVGEDTDLWLRFEESGLRGGYLDEALTIYRHNPKSITRGRTVDGLAQHIKVARKHARILGLSKSFVRKSYAEFLYDMANSYLSNGSRVKAARCLLFSIIYNPVYVKTTFNRLSAYLKKPGKDKNKINIMYYDPSSGFGGSSRCLASWLKKLDREKYGPVVVMHSRGPVSEAIKNMGVKFVHIPLSSPLLNGSVFGGLLSYAFAAADFIVFVLPVAALLVFYILKYRIRIIHLNAKVITVIPGIIAAKITGIACVCHLHDTKEPVRRELLFAGWTDRLIALTEKAFDLYRKSFPYQKLRLIPNGIDIDEYTIPIHGNAIRKEFRIDDSFKIIGIAGRLVNGKGFDDFIRSASILSRKRDDIVYVIVGDDPSYKKTYESFLKKLARDLGVSEKVIFTGWREDAGRIMSEFSVLVQASSTFPEGFGLTVAEAMALEIPVVVTDIAGPSEVSLDGVTGFTVPPANPLRLAEAVERLVDDSDLAERMGRMGRKRISQHFTLQGTVQKIEAVYNELMT